MPGVDPAAVLWDVVVVGAGMGGATLGHQLAAAGHSVLFLEKGHDRFPAPQPFGVQFEDSGARLDAGHWPDKVTARIDGRSSSVFAPLGCGSGGSSTLYAATLERLERDDVEPPPGSGWPGWPMRFDVLREYYARAERLYRVVGTSDPLSRETDPALLPPPPPSPVDRTLAAHFAAAGLHPYRLHLAIRYRPGCLECGGRPCPDDCKMDARAACLVPAVAQHGASLCNDCEVVRLEAGRDRVEAIACRQGTTDVRVRARMFVLAAGAYRSPALLLGSPGPHWPDGLANASGQVGRNLMFHATEMFAGWPAAKASTAGPRKTIGLRDFYRVDGERFGSFQSTGLNADYGAILQVMRDRFDRSVLGRLRPLRALLRVPARLAALLLGRATVFALLIEDRAQPGNRIRFDPADPGRIRIDYTIPDELRRRVLKARRLVRRRLGLRFVLPLQAEVQLNFGHPCGTCRAGHDPATSVVDGDCKAHGLDNLYVVDASFMPTSGGANPSLTIAANAIRVAEAIALRLDTMAARCPVAAC
jgi:choline dehydrogenase-like flavoprotein